MKPLLMDLICPAVLPSIPIGASDTPVEWSEMSRDSPATGVLGEDVKNCIQQAKAIAPHDTCRSTIGGPYAAVKRG